MPRRSPYVVRLTRREKAKLQAMARKYTSPYRDVIRARIVLYAAAFVGMVSDPNTSNMSTLIPRGVTERSTIESGEVRIWLWPSPRPRPSGSETSTQSLRSTNLGGRSHLRSAANYTQRRQRPCSSGGRQESASGQGE